MPRQIDQKIQYRRGIKYAIKLLFILLYELLMLTTVLLLTSRYATTRETITFLMQTELASIILL